MDMPELPPFVMLDPAIGRRLHDALSALTYPIDDYQQFSVVWPLKAVDIESMHEWMHGHGMTPNTK